MNKNIAVIPARGGSKRIPGKNIKDFRGMPVLARTIETAKNSSLFSHIVVSTDSDAIVEVALKYGALVPEKRPESLADDWTPTAPVIRHAVRTLQERGFEFDNICCIYPCTPLLLKEDLDNGLHMLQDTGADFVYPVVEYRHPVQRAMYRDSRGKMVFMDPESELKRTQDLEKTYHDAGQFYWGSAQSWLSEKNMHSHGHGLVVPGWRMVDIDTPEDWERAELVHDVLRSLDGDKG